MNDQPNFQKEKTQEQKNMSFRSSDEAPRLHRDKMYLKMGVVHPWSEPDATRRSINRELGHHVNHLILTA